LLKLVAKIEGPAGQGPGLPPKDVPETRMWRDSAAGVAAYLFRANGMWEICFPNFASYVFAEEGTNENLVKILIRPAAAAPRQQVLDRLRRNVVPLLLQARGFQVFHASAVRVSDGVIGLCGESFSGKSTLAAALARRGFKIWTDDALLVTIEKTATALRAPDVRLRLRSDSRAFFGQWAVSEPERDDEGAEIEINCSSIDKAPLKGLYLIRRVQNLDKATLLLTDRIMGHRAFEEILRQAHYFNLGEIEQNRRISEVCLTVARSVPIYGCSYRDGFSYLDEVAEKLGRCFDAYGLSG
jgi:hypothetical protein